MHDLGMFSFDIKMDLTRLFDWNTKEVFLYLYANYTTQNNVRSACCGVLGTCSALESLSLCFELVVCLSIFVGTAGGDLSEEM